MRKQPATLTKEPRRFSLTLPGVVAPQRGGNFRLARGTTFRLSGSIALDWV